VLNTIEFWSGSNPVALEQGGTLEKTVADRSGHRLHLTVDGGGDHARLELRGAGEARVLDLLQTEAGAELRDGSGLLLATLSGTEDGGAVVRDASGAVRATRSAAEVRALAGAGRLGGLALLAELELQQGRSLASAR
jgi:hypothetical protein